MRFEYFCREIENINVNNHWRIKGGTRDVPSGSIFVQFSGKVGQIIDWRPYLEVADPNWEIPDSPLVTIVVATTPQIANNLGVSGEPLTDYHKIVKYM